uniref:Uncharacterized protein n=1 Tax=viral metagenome TaxID=1070528 RepID=A0A6C0EIL4_9ZZZZ
MGENDNNMNLHFDALDIELNPEISLGGIYTDFTTEESPGTTQTAVQYDVGIQGFCEDLIQGIYQEGSDVNKVEATLLINHGTDNTGLAAQNTNTCVVGRYYRIVTLTTDQTGYPTNDMTFENTTGNRKVGDIFKCEAVNTVTDGTVSDISFNKGGWFVMENPKTYFFSDTQDRSGGLNVLQHPTLSPWAAGAKADVANDNITWHNAEWSRGGVNLDHSGFGNTKGLVANKGVVDAANTSDQSSGIRLVVPATADPINGGIVRCTTYEGAENTYSSTGVKNAIGARVYGSPTAPLKCKTSLLNVGPVIKSDGNGTPNDVDGAYLTYNPLFTNDHVNMGGTRQAGDTTPQPSGSNFIQTSAAYPAINLAELSNVDLKYKNRSSFTKSIFSERYIDNGDDSGPSGAEALSTRVLAADVDPLASGYHKDSTGAADVTTDINLIDASLRKGTTSLADAILLAVSVALSKEAYGNDIVRNDKAMRPTIRAAVRHHLNKIFGYTEQSSGTGNAGLTDGGALAVTIDDALSKPANTFVNQYLTNSGKKKPASGETHKFELDNVDITFLVKVSGTVSDSSQAIVPPATARPPPSKEVVKAVFGDFGRTGSQTLVNSDPGATTAVGGFVVNCLVSIRNINSRLVNLTQPISPATTVSKNTAGLPINTIDNTSGINALKCPIAGISSDNDPDVGSGLIVPTVESLEAI